MHEDMGDTADCKAYIFNTIVSHWKSGIVRREILDYKVREFHGKIQI